MKKHDPRCEGGDDQKLLDDVAEYGWHVIKVLDQPDAPGWAYSVGLFQNFGHPEIMVFGLDLDLMQLIDFVFCFRERHSRRPKRTS